MSSGSCGTVCVPGLGLLIGAEGRRHALVEVEVEVPRLEVLVDVRDVHARAPPEIVARPEIDEPERLVVRDPERAQPGLLRRGEPEKELGLYPG